MTGWENLRDMEESDTIRETRATAQAQFVDLSERYVDLARHAGQLSADLERLRTAWQSARQRAREAAELLDEETR